MESIGCDGCLSVFVDVCGLCECLWVFVSVSDSCGEYVVDGTARMS